MDAISWLPYATLLAINWLSVHRKRIQALMDAYSPPAPSRVEEFDWAGVFTPTPTPTSSSPPPPNPPPTNILVMFLITMITLFLLSFLWFLKRTTIIGEAYAPTRADTSSSSSVSPTKPRWAILSTILVCVLAGTLSSVWLLVAKIATIEGELATQAANFNARLARQSADAIAAATAAADAQLGLQARFDQLMGLFNKANEDQRIAEDEVAAVRAQLDSVVADAAITKANAENEVATVRAQLDSAKASLATTEASLTETVDKFSRLQSLHEALQATYAQVSRDHQILRQRMDFMGRQAGAQSAFGQTGPGFPQTPQQFGRGFQPQQPQHRAPSSPYAQNPGATFGQLPRRQ